MIAAASPACSSDELAAFSALLFGLSPLPVGSAIGRWRRRGGGVTCTGVPPSPASRRQTHGLGAIRAPHCGLGDGRTCGDLRSLGARSSAVSKSMSFLYGFAGHQRSLRFRARRPNAGDPSRDCLIGEGFASVFRSNGRDVGLVGPGGAAVEHRVALCCERCRRLLVSALVFTLGPQLSDAVVKWSVPATLINSPGRHRRHRPDEPAGLHQAQLAGAQRGHRLDGDLRCGHRVLLVESPLATVGETLPAEAG